MKRQVRLTLLLAGLLAVYSLGRAGVVLAKQAKVAANRNPLAMQTFHFDQAHPRLPRPASRSCGPMQPISLVTPNSG